MPKTSKFRIQMKDGSWEEREGQIFGERWAIDKRQEEKVRKTKDGEKVSLSSYFALTYLPTGILVATANTQKTLKELMNREDVIAEDDMLKLLYAVVDFWNKRGWKG